MPTTEIDRSKGELSVAQKALEREVEQSQEVVETFLHTIVQLRQKLSDFLNKMSEPNIAKEIWDYIREVNAATIQYQIHFLSTFHRLLQRIRQYLDLRFITAQTSEQKILTEIYKEIEFYQKMIDNYTIEIHSFTEAMNDIVAPEESSTFLPPETIKTNIQNALNDKVGKFADKALQEVARQLSGMRYMINRVRPLVQR